jgi:site-specific recombinase XerD
LRRPRVPRRLIAPLTDAELHRLLAPAEPRERALVLRPLNTGLRLAEVARLHVGYLRPDSTIRVLGKGSLERIVPIGATARAALLRYVRQRASVIPPIPCSPAARAGSGNAASKSRFDALAGGLAWRRGTNLVGRRPHTRL